METNNINIQLLNAVFFLAALQDRELCYNPEDGGIYQVKARSKAEITLLPLYQGADTPIFHLNPSNLVFRDDMAARSQNIAFPTHNNAIETCHQRPDAHTGNVEPAFAEREYCVTTTDGNEYGTPPQCGCIGKGKVNLPTFSDLYTGEIAKWSAEVETLLDKIFASTNYSKTIAKTVENYNAAKKYAKNGQTYELKQLAERLKGRINKQAAMQSAMDTMAARTAAKRKMLISAVIAILVVALYFGITNYKKHHSTRTETQTQTEFAQLSELDKAIMEWECTTGKKIYPKGRECLAKATVGMNKDQIIKVIQQNIKP